MDARAKGFTLIEIIVTVAIVAMLASLVIPNVIRNDGGGKAKEAAQQFVDYLNALRAESLYDINLFALKFDPEQKSYSALEYTGRIKRGLNNVNVIDAQNRLLPEFELPDYSNNDEEKSSSIWREYTNRSEYKSNRLQETILDSDVSLNIVRIEQPARQDYEEDESLEELLIQFENGIITTPFEIEFEQGDSVYLVTLSELNEIEFKRYDKP